MGFKRPLMILGSTVGAVAAVLSYHPAAGGTATALVSAPETPVDLPVTPTSTPTPTASATPAPTPTPKSTPKKRAKNPVASPTPTSTATTDPTPTSKAAKEETVAGATVRTRWGPVQVQITVKDGKIIDAVGLQYPDGDRRSQFISEQAIPWLVEETLQDQAADVQIIGGATYTSTGWRQSLASAMQKAGL